MRVRRLTTRSLRRRAVAAVAAALATTLLAAPAAASAVATAPADAVRDREYWLDDYGIRSAWEVTRGAGVTIAVLDTGVGRVADLGDAVVGGADFSGDGSADGRTPVGVAETLPHGTMVASLAAGRGTGASSGVLGAAPEASILAVSLGFGEVSEGSDQEIADGVRWAVDNGADVINMSLTRNTLDWPESWDEAFLYAMENDVVVIAAAGNRGAGTEVVGAPVTMPGVLTVSGVDRAGQASVSASTQGITIGVAAPSEQLVGVGPSGEYYVWSGTSGATPIVAGIVALVRAAHPELDAANVIQRVIATSRDAGTPGPDFTYGHGIVDADAAVRAEVAAVDANPVGDLAEWIRLNRPGNADAAGELVGTSPAAPSGSDDAGSGGSAGVDPSGTLLPSITTLQLVGLPVLVVVMITTAAGSAIVGLLRSRGSRASGRSRATG